MEGGGGVCDMMGRGEGCRGASSDLKGERLKVSWPIYDGRRGGRGAGRRDCFQLWPQALSQLTCILLISWDNLKNRKIIVKGCEQQNLSKYRCLPTTVHSQIRCIQVWCHVSGQLFLASLQLWFFQTSIEIAKRNSFISIWNRRSN